MFDTPDLSKEFHPQPKVYKAKKPARALSKTGVKTENWNKGREDLKKRFAAWGITQCEIRLEGCLRDNFLGFAHTERRVNLTLDEVRDYRKVVLACQQCHNVVDNEMQRKASTQLLESIVASRESNL